MSKPSPASRKVRHILGLCLLIVVLAGLPVLTFFHWNNVGVIFGVACFYIAVAFGLRSRLIVGTLAGIGLGLIFDNGVQSGDPETRLWYLIFQLAVGLIIGIMAGILWERAGLVEFEPVDHKPKKRR